MRKILIIVICFLVLLGGVFLFASRLLPSSFGGQEENTLEAYKEDDEIEEEELQAVSNETVDLSGKYSKKEREECRKECEKLMDTYLPLYFNYNRETTAENEKIFRYHNPKYEFYKTAKTTFWTGLDDFVSTYSDYDIGYFDIQDEKDFIVEVGGIVHAKMAGFGLADDDYDVFFTLTLEKVKGKWMVDQFTPSTIFDGGTAMFYKSPVDECIGLRGEYQDTLLPESEDTEEEYDPEDKSPRGDVIDEGIQVGNNGISTE